MTHWKASVFILLVSCVPPFALLAAIYGYGTLWQRSSAIWTTILGLCYAWVLMNITLPFYLSPLRHLPSPPSPTFALAHGPSIFQRPPGSILLKWAKQVPNEGLICWHGFFYRQSFVMLTSPQALKEVLNDNPYDFAKPEAATRFLSKILGNGLILAEGQEHKRQRKCVAPAFQGKHIKDLITMFWSMSVEFTDTVSSQLSPLMSPENADREGLVEINAIASRATLDIIGVAGLGRNFDTLHNSEDGMAKNYETLTDPRGMAILWAINMILPQWLLPLLPLKMKQKVDDASSSLRRTCKILLDDKRTLLTKNSYEHVDILSIMLRSSVELSDQGLIDQLLSFLAAGHETTSSTLTWALYLLSKHQEIQEQLRTELRKHITNDTTFDPRIFDSIPFLNSVCNETLRLFPTVPTTARFAVRPTSILGTPIPMGTQIILSPWVINRLPSLWGADVECFRPDRWLGEDKINTGGAISSYAFLTFLYGPRSCIGQGFARAELKCLLAAMVLRFHLEMANKDEVPVPAGAITIKPRDGLKLRLREL